MRKDAKITTSLAEFAIAGRTTLMKNAESMKTNRLAKMLETAFAVFVIVLINFRAISASAIYSHSAMEGIVSTDSAAKHLTAALKAAKWNVSAKMAGLKIL